MTTYHITTYHLPLITSLGAWQLRWRDRPLSPPAAAAAASAAAGGEDVAAAAAAGGKAATGSEAAATVSGHTVLDLRGHTVPSRGHLLSVYCLLRTTYDSPDCLPLRCRLRLSRCGPRCSAPLTRTRAARRRAAGSSSAQAQSESRGVNISVAARHHRPCSRRCTASRATSCGSTASASTRVAMRA